MREMMCTSFLNHSYVSLGDKFEQDEEWHYRNLFRKVGEKFEKTQEEVNDYRGSVGFGRIGIIGEFKSA